MLQVPAVPVGSFPQLHPLSFGEGIALDPLPPKEMRCVDFDVTARKHLQEKSGTTFVSMWFD